MVFLFLVVFLLSLDTGSVSCRAQEKVHLYLMEKCDFFCSSCGMRRHVNVDV